MIRIIILLALFLQSALAAPPSYQNGRPTADKVDYCEQLVRRYGSDSVKINSDWYGTGVSSPKNGAWVLRIREPWFSDDLYIVYEQVTSDGFEHSAACLWSEDAPWFQFSVNHHYFGRVVLCTLYGDGDGMGCP